MSLLTEFDHLLETLRPCFNQERTFQRARALAYAMPLTFGRRTISRLICSKSTQHLDWTADYRLFSKRLWAADDLFFKILSECDRHSRWPGNDVVIALDDTARRKTGKKIPGVCTLRDPMSLPYHVNLIPGLRFLQGSIIVNPDRQLRHARAIPVLFDEAAPAKKPKKNAPDAAFVLYKEEKKKRRISVQGRQAAIKLRRQVDALPDGAERDLFLAVDGSFCNKYFLRQLPAHVIPIARARKDLKIFKPADDSMRVNRVYGEQLPTPDEIRKDDAYPWKTTRVFYAGAYRMIRYKTVAPVLWPTGTRRQPCRLIVIAPLPYHLKKGGKRLYRQPAYLLVPHVDIPAEQVVQYYLLRWDVEVNHRDEKTLLGVGDAQVRAPQSVERNPQFAVAIYSLLLVASIRAYGAARTDDYLPPPKWRKAEDRRASTLDILSLFRKEVMLAQLDNEAVTQPISKSASKKIPKEGKSPGFVSQAHATRSPSILPVNILSALLYANT